MTKKNEIAQQWCELGDYGQCLVIKDMICDLRIIENNDEDRTALIDFLSFDMLQKKIDKALEVISDVSDMPF